VKVVTVYNNWLLPGHVLQLDDGAWLCPVCARSAFAELPWSPAPESPSPSWDLCPDCGIQYGREDSPFDEPRDVSLDAVWALYREEWMAKESVSPKVLRRIVEMVSRMAVLRG
jgi:hypothetical protein